MGLMAAALVIAIIPEMLMALAVQKYMIRGLTLAQ